MEHWRAFTLRSTLKPKVLIEYSQRTRSWAGREEPDHTHNSTILCLKDPQFQQSVDWLLEVHCSKKTQLPQGQNAHNSFTAIPPHCPHKSSPHFLCGGSNTTFSQPHSTTLLPILWPHSTHNYTGVVCLINNCPRKHLVRVKGHIRPVTYPPFVAAPSCSPVVKHGPTMPRSTGSNKTCINAHTHTAHRSWDTPTSLIRLKCFY